MVAHDTQLSIYLSIYLSGQVAWRANVTIVVASYKYRLDWLKTIPPTFDVAVYDKFDFGAGNASYPNPFGVSNANRRRLSSAAMPGKWLPHRNVNQAPLVRVRVWVRLRGRFSPNPSTTPNPK